MQAAKKASRLFLLLVLIQVVHSSEEILLKLYDWQYVLKYAIYRLTGHYPGFEISGSVFSVMNIIGIALLFLVSISQFRYRLWAFKAGTVIALLELFNGIVHVCGSIILSVYLPGTLSAIIMIVIALLYILNRTQNYKKINKTFQSA
jgi:hypothetical protein